MVCVCVWDNVVTMGLRQYRVQRATCCSCLCAYVCFSISMFCGSFSNQACTYISSSQYSVMYFLISWSCSSCYMFSSYSHINNNFAVSALFVPKIHAFHHIMSFFSSSSKHFFIILQCSVWSVILNVPLFCVTASQLI